MRFCKKCGWKMEYRPRSFQEHIKEIIGEQEKRGYWKCLRCGSIKSRKNSNRV